MKPKIKYIKDDFYNLQNSYESIYTEKESTEDKTVIKEEYDITNTDVESTEVESEIVGGLPDEDNDLLNDTLETKVYSYLNKELGESFKLKCDEVKDKFDLTEDEFIKFFGNWFDKEHVDSHINDDLAEI